MNTTIMCPKIAMLAQVLLAVINLYTFFFLLTNNEYDKLGDCTFINSCFHSKSTIEHVSEVMQSAIT